MSKSIRVRGAIEIVVGMTLALVAGCDSVRTTSQTLRLKLTETSSQDPLQDVHVRIKQSFQGANKADERHLKDFWDGLPWSSGVTDGEGVASIHVLTTQLDRSRSAQPTAGRDVLTGYDYLFIIGEDGERDSMSGNIQLLGGTKVVVAETTVTVVGIDAPTYVETPSDD